MTVEKTNEVAVASIESLQQALQEGNARVGVIGMGYVGLPLALLFVRGGFLTTGFDIDPEKVQKLRAGETYIKHIPAETIAGAIEKKRFRVTDDFNELAEMDAIVICVPTPLDDHREPDLSFIRDTAETICPRLRAGQLVVLESTTYPGTTEEVVLPILERSGLSCPILPYATDGFRISAPPQPSGDFLVAFSPEREDPGNRQFQTHQVPKVIGGINAASALAAQALYGQVFEKTIVVSST